MKLYLSYFKLRIMSFVQYRIAALAGLSTQFFWGMMLIFIYIAFYTNGSGVDSISLTQIITYTWLHQAFYALLSVRLVDDEIADSISSGNVAYEIISPYNLCYLRQNTTVFVDNFYKYSEIVHFNLKFCAKNIIFY